MAPPEPSTWQACASPLRARPTPVAPGGCCEYVVAKKHERVHVAPHFVSPSHHQASEGQLKDGDGQFTQQLATIECKLDDVLRKVDTLAARSGPFIESKLTQGAQSVFHLSTSNGAQSVLHRSTSNGAQSVLHRSTSNGAQSVLHRSTSNGTEAGGDESKSEAKRPRPIIFEVGGLSARDRGAFDLVRPPGGEEPLVRRDRKLPTNVSTLSKKEKGRQVLAERVLAFTEPELKDVLASKHDPEESISEFDGMTRRSSNKKIEAIISTTVKSEDKPLAVDSKFGLPKMFFERMSATQKLLLLDSVMGVVIIANIIILGVSADVNRDWVGWFITDCLFLTVFSLEVAIRVRLQGFRSYVKGPDRMWHFLELLCLATAVLEVTLEMAHSQLADDRGAASVATLRVIRLLRIARILRVARFGVFTELIVMINGTFGGLRTLGWAGVLICLALYALALLFREGLGADPNMTIGHEAFDGVAISFFTMFRCILGGDCAEENGRPLFHHITVNQGWGFAAVYFVCSIFITVGLVNVIVAIFVENVVAAARTNENLMKRQRSRDKVFFAKKMTQLVELITAIEEGRAPEVNSKKLLHSTTARAELFAKAAEIEITPELFEQIRQTQSFGDICHDLEVADEDHFNLFDTLDVDGSGTIDIEELIEGISKLRGDARRSDIVGVSFMVQRLVSESEMAFEKIIAMLQESAAERSPRSPRSPGSPGRRSSKK